MAKGCAVVAVRSVQGLAVVGDWTKRIRCSIALSSQCLVIAFRTDFPASELNQPFHFLKPPKDMSVRINFF